MLFPSCSYKIELNHRSLINALKQFLWHDKNLISSLYAMLCVLHRDPHMQLKRSSINWWEFKTRNKKLTETLWVMVYAEVCQHTEFSLHWDKLEISWRLSVGIRVKKAAFLTHISLMASSTPRTNWALNYKLKLRACTHWNTGCGYWAPRCTKASYHRMGYLWH